MIHINKLLKSLLVALVPLVVATPAAAQATRLSAFAAVPTLGWLADSDAALGTLAVVGCVLSLLLVVGVTNAVLRAQTQRQQVGSPRLSIGRDQPQP